MSRLRVYAAGGMLALLAACGGAVETTERQAESERAQTDVATTERQQSSEVDEPSGAASPEPSEPQVQGGDAAIEYFEAFATAHPADMRRMIELSAKNSPARTYAQVQVATAVAQRAEMGGAAFPPQTLEIVDGEIELCSEPVGEVASAPECFRFSDFETTNGKLASFMAGDTPIDKRVARGGQTLRAGGTTVRLVGAYHSVQADSLIVAFEAEPGSPLVNPSWYSMEYLEPTGDTVASTTAFGPDPLRRGRTSVGVGYFDRADVGGTVTLPAYDNDYNELTLDFELKAYR